MKGVSTVIATILMLMITIALAGMAYMYISGVFTPMTQGIEIADAYCEEGPDTAVFVVRNIGTQPISLPGGITVTQTSPSGATVSMTWEKPTGGGATEIAPGGIVIGKDDCEGSGGRTCMYRFTPAMGRTVTGSVYCT